MKHPILCFESHSVWVENNEDGHIMLGTTLKTHNATCFVYYFGRIIYFHIGFSMVLSLIE